MKIKGDTNSGFSQVSWDVGSVQREVTNQMAKLPFTLVLLPAVSLDFSIHQEKQGSP